MGRGGGKVSQQGGGDGAGGRAIDEFNAKIEEKMARGMSRQRAAAVVARKHPELRQRVVDEANGND